MQRTLAIKNVFGFSLSLYQVHTYRTNHLFYFLCFRYLKINYVAVYDAWFGEDMAKVRDGWHRVFFWVVVGDERNDNYDAINRLCQGVK